MKLDTHTHTSAGIVQPQSVCPKCPFRDLSLLPAQPGQPLVVHTIINEIETIKFLSSDFTRKEVFNSE